MSFYQFDWDPHQAALEEFFTGGRSDRVHEEKEEAPLSPFSSLPDASLEPLDHHYVQSSFSVGGEADWAEGGQGSPDEAATVSSSPSLSGFLPPPALESSDSSPIEQLNYVEDQSQFKEKPIHPSHDAPPSADSFEQDKEEELFGSYDEESDAHSDDGDYVYPKVKTASSKKPVAQKAPRKPLPPVPGHPAIFNNEHPTHPYECPSCGQCYRRKADLKVHAQSKHADNPELAEEITPSRRSKTTKDGQEKPHCCDHPGCPSGYTRKSDLTRHQRETHRDQTSTRNTTFHEYKVTGPCQYKANSNKHQ